MNKPKYWRSKNMTGSFDRDTGKIDVMATITHKSINAAKRESRAIQGSARGTGILVLIRN